MLAAPTAPAGAQTAANHWHYGSAGATSAQGQAQTRDGRPAQVLAFDTGEPVTAATSSAGTCKVGRPDGPDSFQCTPDIASASLDFTIRTSATFACAESFAAKASFDGSTYQPEDAIVSENSCPPASKSGPSPASTYDLGVTVEPGGTLDFDYQDLRWFSPLDWRVTVSNGGPAASPATALTFVAPDTSADADCGRATLSRADISCHVPALAPGASFQTIVDGEVTYVDLSSGAAPASTASVPCGSPQESDCANNGVTVSAAIAFAPRVRLRRMPIERARARLALTGRAAPDPPPPGSSAARAASGAPSAVAAVEVAVLRVAARSCPWLNRAGHLIDQRLDHGVCDTPIWLRAHGRGSWHYVIARGLRPGRYAVYARAISASGASDLSFGAGRGNAITLVVR